MYILTIGGIVNPDMKIFVGDSLAGNDTVSQAREFYKHTTFDGAILTKSDADARGGAALSIVKVTSAPVLYVGVVQEYQELKAFDKELFLNTDKVFRKKLKYTLKYYYEDQLGFNVSWNSDIQSCTLKLILKWD